jgi:hypothetical protein
MKPKPQSAGGRPIDYLRRCIVMEVQLEKRCCRRTAERHLSERNCQYDELQTDHPVECLDVWHQLSEFDQGDMSEFWKARWRTWRLKGG